MRIWTTPVLRFGVRGDKFRLDLFPGTDNAAGVDERISRIDEARANLITALSAVDELKTTAERNKLELRDALQRIAAARRDKAAAEKELHSVKLIAQGDVEVFKKLAGVPSRRDIALGRLIGFGLGVLASIIASVLWRPVSK